MTLYEELNWRGLTHDKTEGVLEWLKQSCVTAYTGFDPTGDSLHVGSLVPLLGLARLQRAGHKPIALAGGGTGMIGDPSGKTSERQLISSKQVEANLTCIRLQMERFLDFKHKTNPAVILNNADWLGSISFLDFLRDIGKHFTVNYMIAKESVRGRIEREDGISFTEFSYMLLQAYDFYYLQQNHGCSLQTGGSDQWGNITAGIELIRRIKGEKAYGLVYPLVTKSDGGKFGKTERGNIWLDPAKTSPYRFFQFWLNCDDHDVIQYLKWFTFLDRKEIQQWAQSVQSEPEKREAQRTLAKNLTRLVHDETGLSAAQRASSVLFGGSLEGIRVNEIADIFADVPASEISREDLSGDGKNLIELLAESGLLSSKGEARKAIQGGGIYVNNHKVADISHRVGLSQSIEGQFFILRKGKKNYHLVKILH